MVPGVTDLLQSSVSVCVLVPFAAPAVVMPATQSSSCAVLCQPGSESPVTGSTVSFEAQGNCITHMYICLCMGVHVYCTWLCGLSPQGCTNMLCRCFSWTCTEVADPSAAEHCSCPLQLIDHWVYCWPYCAPNLEHQLVWQEDDRDSIWRKQCCCIMPNNCYSSVSSDSRKVCCCCFYSLSTGWGRTCKSYTVYCCTAGVPRLAHAVRLLPAWEHVVRCSAPQ